jgi:hypothetical protein
MAADSSNAGGIPTVTDNCVKQGLIKNAFHLIFPLVEFFE